jgi:hypothetical protein
MRYQDHQYLVKILTIAVPLALSVSLIIAGIHPFIDGNNTKMSQDAAFGFALLMVMGCTLSVVSVAISIRLWFVGRSGDAPRPHDERPTRALRRVSNLPVGKMRLLEATIVSVAVIAGVLSSVSMSSGPVASPNVGWSFAGYVITGTSLGFLMVITTIFRESTKHS